MTDEEIARLALLRESQPSVRAPAHKKEKQGDVQVSSEIDVDAENEAEAESISNGIDLNDWVAVEDVNFEILSVEEVENA